MFIEPLLASLDFISIVSGGMEGITYFFDINFLI